jgi:flagellar biosynthesis protein FlhG
MKRIYSIGGGKGGTGKSFVAANLGILLAKQGRSVVLVDLDLGAANLHTFLGLKGTRRGIESFLNRETRKLEEAAESTGVPNLALISSARCPLEIANLFYAQKGKIIRAIRGLPHDYVILDLGSGTHFNTLDFFLAAHEGLLVITPEPTAIENTFRFIKSIYLREFKKALTQSGKWLLPKGTITKLLSEKMKSPGELIRTLQERGDTRASRLRESLDKLKFRVIVNKFRQPSDANLGDQIVAVCNRHFFTNFFFLGNVAYDNRVHDAIARQSIFVNKSPYTRTAVDLQNMVKTLLGDSTVSANTVISG